LNAAFNSEFMEGGTLTYDLEDTDEDIVRLLVYGIYTGCLDINIITCDRVKGNHYCLIRVWILADSLAMAPLQNLVIEKLHEFNSLREFQRCMVSDLTSIYNRTAPGAYSENLQLPPALRSSVPVVSVQSWLTILITMDIRRHSLLNSSSTTHDTSTTTITG
jgi:hypothetical protein